MLHSSVDSVFPCNLDFHDPITALLVCRSPHCKHFLPLLWQYWFNFRVFDVGAKLSIEVSRAPHRPHLVSKDDKGKKVYQPTVFQMGFQRTDVALMSIDLSSSRMAPAIQALRHCMICTKKGQPYQVGNTSNNWKFHAISTMMTGLSCHIVILVQRRTMLVHQLRKVESMVNPLIFAQVRSRLCKLLNASTILSQ